VSNDCLFFNISVLRIHFIIFKIQHSKKYFVLIPNFVVNFRRNCSKINLMSDDKKLDEKLISFDNWVKELVDLVPASVYVR
jgi:hypothetical protein